MKEIFSELKKQLSLVNIIYILLLVGASITVFYKFNSPHHMKYNGPTMLSCSLETVWSTVQFGYGKECCCNADHQPLYILGLKLWTNLFGFEIAPAKGFSFLFYILSLISIFLIGLKSFTNRFFQYLFPLVFFLNTMLLDMGTYIYMYIHYFFIVLLTVLNHVYSKEDRKNEDLVFSTLLILLMASLTFYMSYGYLWVYAFFAFLIFKTKLDKKNTAILITSALLFGIKTPVIFLFRFIERDANDYTYNLESFFNQFNSLMVGMYTNSIIISSFSLGVMIIGFYYLKKLIFLENNFNQKLLRSYLLLTSLGCMGMYLFLGHGLKVDEIKIMYFIFLIFVSWFYFFNFLEVQKPLFKWVGILGVFVVLSFTFYSRFNWKAKPTLIAPIQQLERFQDQKIYGSGHATYWLKGALRGVTGQIIKKFQFDEAVKENEFVLVSNGFDESINDSVEQLREHYPELKTWKVRQNFFPLNWHYYHFKK